ncbi:hypothetical protein REC12_18855 [Desulfosporosinus sp. PR]|nr:hypothetical protein [Desulfosporosinus sp. PR]MDQ7095653.1 hypothetical protein [Desulfosporosinus sp. PR]
MTAQEKRTIESILADVGLEPLHTARDDEREPTLKPVISMKTRS